MTFDDYWNRLVARNPSMADPETKMTITVESFRKSTKAAFIAGSDQADKATSFLERLLGK